MTIVPEITSVDGVARHSQIIRLPAPPSLFVDNNCRRAGTKQMGARGEAQGIRWYGGLHGQNSARGKFRTSPRKMRGKFRTKLKYGIFPAEKSPRGISPPPVQMSTIVQVLGRKLETLFVSRQCRNSDFASFARAMATLGRAPQHPQYPLEGYHGSQSR